MWAGSWLPALATLPTNPSGCTSRHVHVPASSPCLPPFSGPSFLNPKEESDFDLGLREIVPFVPCHFTTLFALHKFLMIQSLGSFNAFVSLATWCGTFYVRFFPTKRKVMSSSHSTSFLLCWSSVELFYGFLGMFHVGFIHPRSFYRMVSFPLN
jgi:hypothetical protein